MPMFRDPGAGSTVVMRGIVRAGLVSGMAVVALTTAGADALWAAGSKEGGMLPGSSNKEPISIDAGKLDYFDKEQKLIYSGEVVAKQGASTLKGSVLTIYLAKQAGKDDKADKEPGAAPAPGGSSIRSMDVAGPVTVISRDQVGTGDSGRYDKAANTMTLTGHVTLTQGTNIVKGDRLIYDMTTGQAQVWSGQTQGRVRSVFTPSSNGGAGASSSASRGRAPVNLMPGGAATATGGPAAKSP